MKKELYKEVPFSVYGQEANTDTWKNPWNQDKLTEDVRWKCGLLPTGNANYAWIKHLIHHLASHGKIGLVLANGALSTQNVYNFVGFGRDWSEIVVDGKNEREMGK